jgi:hypothetical protein
MTPPSNDACGGQRRHQDQVPEQEQANYVSLKRPSPKYRRQTFEHDHAEANRQRYACRYDGVANGSFRQYGHTRDVTRLFLRYDLVVDSCNDRVDASP